jgi:NAD(P)H dehydrogenase (quinone)
MTRSSNPTAANVRLAIVYYSTYGTNHQMAQVAAEAALAAAAEVRLRRVRETAPDGVVAQQPHWKSHVERARGIPEVSAADMEWANAYLLSAPTRYGAVASQMLSFVDTLGSLWKEGKLAGKAASAMSSAQNEHGGQEMTVQAMNALFCHWGCVIVPPGYTGAAQFQAGGNPYGVTVTANGQPVSDAVKEAIRHQTRRLVTFGAMLAVGNSA